MIPVPKDNGISKGYLRPADGIVLFGTGPGVDRGGVNWNGSCYRVMGTKLVRVEISGSVTTLADVGGSGQCSFDYSFDRLGIASSGNLYYWDGSALTHVTDSDLGVVTDFIWVDGYFMTTDGTSLVVTELNAPTSVNPLKYGSAEADPDSIMAILKLRNEPYAVGRYTVEVFQNVGGDYFPFSRISGAQMMRGSIGVHTACVYQENLVFMGGGRNEQTAIWVGSNGSTAKISTREIDQILLSFTETQLADSLMEVRVTNGHNLLYIHLPDRTLVYDGAASNELSEPVWFILHSGITAPSIYRARNFVWCYGNGYVVIQRHQILDTLLVSCHLILVMLYRGSLAPQSHITKVQELCSMRLN